MWSICALSPGYFQTLVGADVCEHSLHMHHHDGPYSRYVELVGHNQGFRFVLI